MLAQISAKNNCKKVNVLGMFTLREFEPKSWHQTDRNKILPFD